MKKSGNSSRWTSKAVIFFYLLVIIIQKLNGDDDIPFDLIWQTVYLDGVFNIEFQDYIYVLLEK